MNWGGKLKLRVKSLFSSTEDLNGKQKSNANGNRSLKLFSKWKKQQRQLTQSSPDILDKDEEPKFANLSRGNRDSVRNRRASIASVTITEANSNWNGFSASVIASEFQNQPEFFRGKSLEEISEDVDTDWKKLDLDMFQHDYDEHCDSNGNGTKSSPQTRPSMGIPAKFVAHPSMRIGGSKSSSFQRSSGYSSEERDLNDESLKPEGESLEGGNENKENQTTTFHRSKSWDESEIEPINGNHPVPKARTRKTVQLTQEIIDEVNGNINANRDGNNMDSSKDSAKLQTKRPVPRPRTSKYSDEQQRKISTGSGSYPDDKSRTDIHAVELTDIQPVKCTPPLPKKFNRNALSKRKEMYNNYQKQQV